jgi:glycosyltransferase involved in cell wall biosynthesis
MSRIFVVGWELPGHAPGQRMEAANYRTWQLVEPLLRDGHDVYLVAGRIGADFVESSSPPVIDGRLTHVRWRFSQPFWIRGLQDLHDAFLPDCVVGITFLGALRATQLRTKAPLWLDIYGDQMAEMQAKAAVVRSDRGIATQLGFLRQVLRGGDAFSTCSGAQRHALLGQLAMVGRLNRATFGYEMAHVMPPGASLPERCPDKGALRGAIVDPAATIALWCGGYNTWTDVDTLYRGLEMAMEADRRLHFVSVGGALAGCDSYSRFEAMVAASPHRERFHLLGWRPASEVPAFYADADIGLTLDAACYEAELGTRTRLAEMMSFGLPIVTTLACELSYVIRDQRLGRTFAIGDWRQMAHHLNDLCQRQAHRLEIGRRARSYVGEALSLEQTTAPLRDWVQAPTRAPDRRPQTSDVFSLEHAARAALRHTMWSLAGLDH